MNLEKMKVLCDTCAIDCCPVVMDITDCKDYEPKDDGAWDAVNVDINAQSDSPTGTIIDETKNNEFKLLTKEEALSLVVKDK